MLELKSSYYQNLLNVNGYFTLKLIDDGNHSAIKKYIYQKF